MYTFFENTDIRIKKMIKKEGDNMTVHTQHLLEECNSGCKMAIRSMEQVSEYVEDEKLEQVIESCKCAHEKLEEESGKLLEECGKEEKEPGMIATAFSWISTETKLAMKNSDNQIAKVLMDGCNMGIQSIGEYMNEYKGASEEAKKIAKKLVKLEENFMSDLKKFL